MDETIKKIREGVETLPEETKTLLKAKLRGHLCIILNSEGKHKAEAVEDMGYEMKKLGL